MTGYQLASFVSSEEISPEILHRSIFENSFYACDSDLDLSNFLRDDQNDVAVGDVFSPDVYTCDNSDCASGSIDTTTPTTISSNNPSSSLYTAANLTNSSYTMGLVCCSASNGCNNMTSLTLDSASYTSGVVSLRCDGQSACGDTRNLTFNLQNNNSAIIKEGNNMVASPYNDFFNTYYDVFVNESIYAAGYQSLSNVGMISGNNYNLVNLYCTGSESCRNIRQISNVSNIYCTGRYSCNGISLIQNVFGNIYGYGRYALQDYIIETVYLTINNVIGNVYCGGIRNCEYVTISNIGGSVYGVGRSSLREANIDTVGQSVVGVGYEALFSSVLTDVTNIVCNGERTCHNTTIDNFESIKTFGMNTMKGARIFSGNQGKTVTIDINGTNLYLFDIYCNETDICQINCQSTDACGALQLHCMGNSTNQCIVSCNSDFLDNDDDDGEGIKCPWIGGDNYILAPTSAPTLDPTSQETTSGQKTTRLQSSQASDTTSTSGSDIDGASTTITATAMRSTKGNGNGNGSSGSNDNSDNDGLSDIVLVVLIISITALIICVIIACIVGYYFQNSFYLKQEMAARRTTRRQGDEQELLQINGGTATHSKQSNNDNGDAQLVIQKSQQV